MSQEPGHVKPIKPGGAAGDRTSPTAPGTPVVTNASASGTATVSFPAATDNVAVVDYAVYVDGSNNAFVDGYNRCLNDFRICRRQRWISLTSPANYYYSIRLTRHK